VGLFDQLRDRANSLGLAVRGAFHPHPRELDPSLPGTLAGTVVLLGFTGSLQWRRFEESLEAVDGLPHPLERWSRRIVGALAAEFRALEVYPNGPPSPTVPFQRLALRCEPVHQSPIGLLIHSKWGLWHAYRGALVLTERIPLPDFAPSIHPCSGCATKPCLSGCPVRAFSADSFDLERCVAHVESVRGLDCRENGCRARRACPVGAQFSYAPQQAQFHMRAFLRSVE
jgi:hypothetical protein